MDYTNLKERMEKSIGAFKEKLSEIRAGRANPAILNKVKIDYYGTPTPINQVAGVSVPEARLIVIQPWDISVLKEIEKAILKSDLGINPSNDGAIIRLLVPELTEETRKNIVKNVKKAGEDAKVALRSIRRDANEKIKALKKYYINITIVLQIRQLYYSLSKNLDFYRKKGKINVSVKK